MAKIDLSKIAEPISDEQPCGPDLDMEYDMDFMNLVAELEGAMPTSYFRFEPSSFNFDGFYDRIGEQLERTHDLRMLVPVAKLRILQGDLAGCAEAIDAMRKLLKTFWTDAHPQALDGDWILRTSQLLTLDDNPNMVLPMQHAPIIRSRRSGVINLRKWQVATGEINPREGEDKLDANSITSALQEAEAADIEKAVASLELIEDALADIQRITISEAGYENAVTLDRLPKAIEGMLELIRSATGAGGEQGVGGEAGAAGEAGGTVFGTVMLPPGAVKSRKEAKEALDIAHTYFLINEPSNPAQLLLREAIGLIDKGFYSLVYDLLPSQASNSVFRLGKDPYFELSVPEVDSRNPAPEIPSEESESESWAETGLGEDEEASGEVDEYASEAGEDDARESAEAGDSGYDTGEAGEGEDSSWETESGEDSDAPGEEVSGEEASAEADGGWGEEAGGAAEDEQAPEEETEEEVEPGPQFWANNRPEAVALMEKVIAYYQVAEPTSPVPLLLERAIQLSSMKFMDLLANVLPRDSLRWQQSDY